MTLFPCSATRVVVSGFVKSFGDAWRRKYCQMSQQVCTAALENAAFFKSCTSNPGRTLHNGFEELAKHSQNVAPLLDRIRLEAPKYDFSAETPGNGYRSFLTIFDCLFSRCIVLCKSVHRHRNTLAFNMYRAKYIEDLKSWNEMLVALFTFLEHLNTLIEWNQKEGSLSLFPSAQHSSQELLLKAQAIEPYSFYGRHAGFQFCLSMGKTLNRMLTLMAGYSDYYFSTSEPVWKVANSLYMMTKYSYNTEHRAKRIVNVSQFATVDFCKSFWFLAESDLMKKLPQHVCPAIQVNQVIDIPTEPLQIRLERGSVKIPIPCAHGPPAPIKVRLLCARRRPGMPGAHSRDALMPLSDNIIIHCHGGGFVAQSSKSHECYLRHWAVALDVPILSVDYSLAPEFPFPRQLQEILYVYAWVISNPHLLGTTAKRIFFVGDSAGANMLLSTTLWASDLQLPLPSGLFLAYVPLLVQFVPSPSRLLCLTDPLLPFGFMMRCLKAYAGHIDISPTNEGLPYKLNDSSVIAAQHNTVQDPNQLDYLEAHSPTDELDLFSVPHSPFLSPCLASDAALKKLPPISLLTTQLDPCLDDSVEFARRCRRLGCDVTLDVLSEVAHGFLNFALVSAEAKEGSKVCIQRIRALMQKSNPPL